MRKPKRIPRICVPRSERKLWPRFIVGELVRSERGLFRVASREGFRARLVQVLEPGREDRVPEERDIDIDEARIFQTYTRVPADS